MTDRQRIKHLEYGEVSDARWVKFTVVDHEVYTEFAISPQYDHCGRVALGWVSCSHMSYDEIAECYQTIVDAVRNESIAYS